MAQTTIVPLGLVLVVGILPLAAQPPRGTAASAVRPALEVARTLAARYPGAVSMSYIPALSWSGALRLSALTGDTALREKVRRDLRPFLSGAQPALAAPYRLTSLAGHLALADLAVLDADPIAGELARKAADLILPQSDGELVRFATGWTDDMFMASALLSRVAIRSGDERYARVLGRLLISYAGKLQRPDGLFVHAVEAPHAWGRGNGFALLGLTEALTRLPESWSDRPRVLDIYRRQVRGLLAHQSEDGSWRQVVDAPASYQELSVTAMSVVALRRGVRHGWLDAALGAAVERAWGAVLARVDADGSVRGVCESTGAGPTREYYMTRRAISGADDRGGAMALLAALEMAGAP